MKRAVEPVGPGPNRFDDSAATVDVDAAGELVLRIWRRRRQWVCAEVIGAEPTGYGRYEWTVRTDLTSLDRNVVCGMFTWSDEPASHHGEIDVEVSAWGQAAGAIGQFVVQPADRAGHVHRFAAPRAGAWRCSFDWSSQRVAFAATGAEPWTFAGVSVPRPIGVHPRINLWLACQPQPANGQPVTVTFGDFRFTPAPG